MNSCQQCGRGPLVDGARGRTPKYCGARCRKRAQREREAPRIALKKAIPDELIHCDRWVNWVYQHSGGRTAKVPTQTNGKRASSTNPATWASFDDVNATGAGVGFALNGDGITCVDIDDCVRPDRILVWARDIVDHALTLGAWVEVSPSGTGLHIWGVSTMVPAGRVVRWNARKVEAYSDSRYLTVTGQSYPGSGNALVDIDEIIEMIGVEVNPCG